MRNTGVLFFGGLLILIGLASLVGALFEVNVWALFWPLLLVGLGVWLLIRPRLVGPDHGLEINFIGDFNRSGNWRAVNEELYTFVGDINLDLTRAELKLGETVYRFTGFIADVDVNIPADVGVAVSASGFVIGVNFFGRKMDQFLVPVEWQTPNYAAAERKIRIEATFFVTDLTIKQS